MTNNHLVYGAPDIPENQEWSVDGYLVGKAVRKCPKQFKEFNQLQFIGASGSNFHFIGDLTKVLVCSIVFKPKSK